MAQYTPNYNLYKPDSSDDFADFRAEHNNNMDIIDANLGGGGGSGGHTIIDENGQSMTQRTGLEFTGNVQVTDDSVNDKTIVDILGGGGAVLGAFADTSNLIYSGTYSLNLSYTATEDCFIWFAMPLSPSTSGKANIDGVQVSTFWNGTGAVITDSKAFFLKKGQVLTATATNSSSASYNVYGIIQGTNGIFAPVIYSDTERKIGVWRDNKPLYQRTFVLSSPITVNGSGTLLPNDMQTALADVEIMVDSECARDSTYSAFISPYVYKSGGQWYILSADNWGNVKFITLRYTKTTDVAGSADWNTDGIPTHHYSTSEQVVGTWLGKPLYENVLTLTQDTNLITDSWVKTEFDRLTMKSLIKVIAVIESSGAVVEALSGGFIDNKLSLNSPRNVGLNVADNARLIVQYTKTTD